MLDQPITTKMIAGPPVAAVRLWLVPAMARAAGSFPLRPSGGKGRGPSRSDGRVWWVLAGVPESSTSP